MKRRIDDILFNGYVREPLPIVVFALAVGVAFLVLSICATCDLFFASPPNSSMKEVVFVEYELDGPIYRLTSSNGGVYDLPVNAVDNISLIDTLICNSSCVTVRCSLTEDKDVMSYDILSISSLDGISILSEDKISKARANNAYTATVIICTACVFYIIFITTSYYVVSNAPRFPRIASLLIRKSFRNF